MCTHSRRWSRCILHFFFCFFVVLPPAIKSSHRVFDEISSQFKAGHPPRVYPIFCDSSVDKQGWKMDGWIPAGVGHITPARSECIPRLDLFTERPFQPIAEIWSPLTEFPARRSLIRINGGDKSLQTDGSFDYWLREWEKKQNDDTKGFQSSSIVKPNPRLR